MSERLVVKADKYFRRTDTLLAHALSHMSPETGLAYRTSKKKKIIERTVAFPLAITATPVIGILAAAVKLDGGPAFYKAERIGKNGEVFNAIKLRSLKKDADKNPEANRANVLAAGIPDDERSTRLGTWMRRWRFDELPQLWQVVGGTMALIEMRADSKETWDLLKDMRQKGIKISGEEERKSGEVLYSDAIVTEPGAINPLTAFYRRGTMNERYGYYAFWGRKASLGFSGYIIFTTIARPFLESKKKENVISTNCHKDVS